MHLWPKTPPQTPSGSATQGSVKTLVLGEAVKSDSILAKISRRLGLFSQALYSFRLCQPREPALQVHSQFSISLKSVQAREWAP